MIKQILLVIAILGFVSHSACAESDAQLASGSSDIVNALNLPNATLAQMVKQIVVQLRSKGVCKSSFFSSDIATCLRGDEDSNYYGELNKYLDYATKTGKLDKVESLNLAIAFTLIADVKGNTVNDIQLATAPLRDYPTGNSVPLPPILQYRQNKAAFAALRKSKGREVVLPADLVAQISKSFPREINGVGNVPAEQYLAAMMGRMQLNELAGSMVTATDFLARPDARVILYPANYAAISDELKDLQSQEVTLAEQVSAESNPAKRAALQTQLRALLVKSDALRAKDSVDELISQRAIKNETLQNDLLKLASLGVKDADRISTGIELQGLVRDLDSIDKQLASQIRIEELPPEDLQRFIINTLKSDFQALKEEPSFQSMPIVLADTLLAAWVGGDLSSDAVRAVSQLAGLKETHVSVWSQALGVTWTIGKTALMAFPATAYIAIGISIFEEIQTQTAAAAEKNSDETHLIPLSH